MAPSVSPPQYENFCVYSPPISGCFGEDCLMTLIGKQCEKKMALDKILTKIVGISSVLEVLCIFWQKCCLTDIISTTELNI